MRDQEVDAAIARQIEEGYRQLRQSMEALTSTVSRDVARDDFLRWKLDLLWRLRDFQTQLHKQFDLEEEGGFLGDVMRLAPQYAARVETLQEEHEKIVVDLNHVITVLKGIQEPASAKIGRVRERLAEVIDLFERHEASEHGLLQDLYFQDYGSGD